MLVGCNLVHLGCGTARRGGPYSMGEVATSDPLVARGQHAFMINCNQCHPGGAAGLGPGINDKPLPPFLIHTQIRAGLGAMPAFDKSKISEQDVDAIITYLKSLRALDTSRVAQAK
jgi:mono/diheme cytochrome c family protein